MARHLRVNVSARAPEALQPSQPKPQQRARSGRIKSALATACNRLQPLAAACNRLQLLEATECHPYHRLQILDMCWTRRASRSALCHGRRWPSASRQVGAGRQAGVSDGGRKAAERSGSVTTERCSASGKGGLTCAEAARVGCACSADVFRRYCVSLTESTFGFGAPLRGQRAAVLKYSTAGCSSDARPKLQPSTAVAEYEGQPTRGPHSRKMARGRERATWRPRLRYSTHGFRLQSRQVCQSAQLHCCAAACERPLPLRCGTGASCGCAMYASHARCNRLLRGCALPCETRHRALSAPLAALQRG